MQKKGFSGQQRRIYRMLGEGFGVSEIAAYTGLSPRTVESYCARMMAKGKADGMKALRRRAIADRRPTR